MNDLDKLATEFQFKLLAINELPIGYRMDSTEFRLP